ncbi:MAG TPA: DUF2147 domain-containing protein [Candidatus Aminicenantes bacterium]|nr:DUF2147 domain-containing protein [Candidatus Aminicenantes bacterium]
MNTARRIQTCLFCLLFLTTMASIHAESGSPEGYWKTIDDETGEVKSIVKVWIDETAMLRGRILKIFPKPGEDPDPVCDKCKGKLKDKKIIGMVFMWGFEKKGDHWVDGKIVDPENGKQYHCRVHTENGGSELKVYGYIKFIVKIGRTQTWIRTDHTATSG